MAWVVKNINGDGSLVEKSFPTYEEAKSYQEWTAGNIEYKDNESGGRKNNMNENDMKEIKIIINEMLSSAIGREYSERILNDKFMNDVIDNIIECSAWKENGYYNDDDVRLAIGRILIDRLQIDE